MKLPIIMHIGYVNTWPGEFRVNHLVDLFAVSCRGHGGRIEFYVVAFNVGIWISAETRRNYDARHDRAFAKVQQLLDERRAAALKESTQ